MKSKITLILILSITLILTITLAFASSCLCKPKSNTELITFEGDLTGSQIVEDCCSNAGSYPEYTMNLSHNFPEDFRGNHTGNLFLNRFGRRLPWAYKVQFWWGEENEYFIEIRGGKVQEDKRNKIIIVTYTKEDRCWTWDPNDVEEIIFIEFTLIREPQIL